MEEEIEILEIDNTEQVVPIQELEALYALTTQAVVKRIKSGPHTRPGRIIKQSLHKGRPRVSLVKGDGKAVHFFIHKLMAKHFFKNYKDGYKIVHLDGDITNNKLDNLDVVTPEDLKLDLNTNILCPSIEGKIEEWRPVHGYTNTYEVSNLARARRVETGKILSPGVGTNGYLHIALCQNGIPRTTYLHVLVAETFLGPRPEGLVINHIDHNKFNNWSSNLEYITQKENLAQAEEKGFLVRGAHKKTSDEDRRKIQLIFSTGAFSEDEIGQKFGISRSWVSQIVNHK